MRAACGRAGVSAESVYRLRRRDALFAQGWSAALVLAREAAGDELACRALHGVREAVFYRGEEVGHRVRFDARLLLAHVARLDALALDARARGDAARFDELLAAVAGAQADEDLYEFADPELAEPEPALPMTRDEYAARRAQAAVAAGIDWGLDDDDDDDDDNDAIAGAESEETEDAEELDPFAARAAAEGEWNAWFASACGTVDALVAGADDAPIEVKSIGDASNPPREREDFRSWTLSTVSTSRPYASPTFTPFQNAMRSRIASAFSLGSG